MRKIIAQEMVTVDGYFAGPNGELDWFVWDDVLKNLSRDMLKSVDTLLFGRVTYDMMAAYWPTVSDEDPVIQKAMRFTQNCFFPVSGKSRVEQYPAGQGGYPRRDHEDERAAREGHGDIWQWQPRIRVRPPWTDR